MPFALGDKAWEQLPNLKRHFDAINARTAVQRVNALRERHAFKTELDDEARRAMFPHNERLKA
jgi:GST-like protein